MAGALGGTLSGFAVDWVPSSWYCRVRTVAFFGFATAAVFADPVAGVTAGGAVTVPVEEI